MRRAFLFLVAAAAFFGASSAACAQRPPIVTEDPGEYAQVFADAMTLSGVAPIRQAFSTIVGGAGGSIPADAEAALIVFERANLETPATVSRVVDDLTAGGAYRVIYLYHYFGGNAWVFTRLEFARISETGWAMSRLAFADSWAGVAIAATPGLVPTSRNRR